LIKAGFYPKHWRTKSKAEVDFIIEKDKEIIPIEVKINAHAIKVEKSLRAFIESYKPKRAFIVTYKGEKGKRKINNCDVFFIDVLEMGKLLMK